MPQKKIITDREKGPMLRFYYGAARGIQYLNLGKEAQLYLGEKQRILLHVVS